MNLGGRASPARKTDTAVGGLLARARSTLTGVGANFGSGASAGAAAQKSRRAPVPAPDLSTDKAEAALQLFTNQGERPHIVGRIKERGDGPAVLFNNLDRWAR